MLLQNPARRPSGKKEERLTLCSRAVDMSDHDLGTVPDQVVQRPQQRAPPVADLFRHRDEHHRAPAAGGRAPLLVQLVRQ